MSISCLKGWKRLDEKSDVYIDDSVTNKSCIADAVFAELEERIKRKIFHLVIIDILTFLKLGCNINLLLIVLST